MCGICGILSWEKPVSREIVSRMCRRLRHRGPDGQGIIEQGPIALGHRRLAVIDLSDAAGQPMWDHSGRFCIVFNGEIYNFESLRALLAERGAVFRSRSDTEVILESFRAWGPACLERFNGMFAFALWDREREILFLARDRLGKKPLFYHELPDGGVVFASELKAVCEYPVVRRRVNPRALAQYLSLNYVLGSEVMFEGVSKLAPAACRLFQRGMRHEPRHYWDLAAKFREKQPCSEREALERFSPLFDDAVAQRLVSDVPLGSFLSGGLDSSSIVAAMCRLRDPASTYSFTIGFKEESYNELPAARAAAAHLKVLHRERMVDADMTDVLPQIVYHCDEPFADSSIIPMYWLAEFSRRHITVALSGDGADEIFAGYETYTADALRHYTRAVPTWLTSCLAAGYQSLRRADFGKVSRDYKLRSFLRGHALPAAAAHYKWREIFSAEEQQLLLQPAVRRMLEGGEALRDFLEFDSQVADRHYLDRALYVDLKTWLPDDILVKLDRSTMAHGLEARSPFLDYRLVEFAASLPVSLKMPCLRKKHLLKRAQRPYLPAAVIDRRKSGFNAPVSQWMLHSLGEQCRLLVQRNVLTEYVNAEYVDLLLRQHETRQADNGLKLLCLLNLGLWMEQFIQ